jgi:hypothetical protein
LSLKILQNMIKRNEIWQVPWASGFMLLVLGCWKWQLMYSEKWSLQNTVVLIRVIDSYYWQIRFLKSFKIKANLRYDIYASQKCTCGPRYSLTFYLQIRILTFEKCTKLTSFQSKMAFLYAISRFALCYIYKRNFLIQKLKMHVRKLEPECLNTS